MDIKLKFVSGEKPYKVLLDGSINLLKSYLKRGDRRGCSGRGCGNCDICYLMRTMGIKPESITFVDDFIKALWAWNDGIPIEQEDF